MEVVVRGGTQPEGQVELRELRASVATPGHRNMGVACAVDVPDQRPIGISLTVPADPGVVASLGFAGDVEVVRNVTDAHGRPPRAGGTGDGF